MTRTIQLSGGVAQLQANPAASASFPSVSSSLIYSASAYCAWPRILKLADGSGYLVAIKAGVSHVGAGNCKILFSSDFSAWSVRATIEPESPTNSIADATLCQHADGRIQLISRHQTDGVHASRNRVQYSSDNGATWTATAAITGPSGYAYMTTRAGSDIYLVTYDNSSSVNLYRFTGDATAELVANIGDATANSETGICVRDSGEMVAHIRHGASGNASTIRSASAPYTSWTTRGTWYPWQGQAIRKDASGTLWGIGRWFHTPAAASGKTVTAVVRYDGFTPVVVAYLPPLDATSNVGDVGYGDLVWVGSESYPRAVYYAPGGTTTAIYTATITPA